MKRRPSFLKKIWRKLVSPKPVERKKNSESTRKVTSSVEFLEGRISPAALINPTTLMFKDLDGDIVTVKFTKSIFTKDAIGLGAANNVFKFSDGANPITNAVTGLTFDVANQVAQQLLLIDLTVAPSAGGKNLAIGTGITVTTVKAATGNGVADIGYIKATNLPLGAISLNGDLGQIDAGSTSVATAITSLKVKSLGERPVEATQPVAGRSLVSNITGALGSLTVTGDVNGASILVVGGTTAIGKIGNITIGGSLEGRALIEPASDNTGLIKAAGDIGLVKIGTLPTQGIVGGGGDNSGRIESGGKIAGLTVSGDIAGSINDPTGTAVGNGSVHAVGSIGPILIKGSLKGGMAENSGSITGFTFGTVTVGGSIVGGGDNATGIIASTKDIGAVKVTGSIIGDQAGVTTANSIDVGGIRALGKIGAVTIVGSLQGGSQASSAFVSSGGDMGAVTVAAITGGAGQNSGTITAGGKLLTALTVKGNVTGGAGAGSGSVFTGVDSNFVGDLGAVKIGGRLIGGALDNSGTIVSGGKILSVTVGPTTLPISADAALKGGAGNFSGSIFSKGTMGAVNINGHVEGGGGVSSGAIVSDDLINEALESVGNMGVVVVTGHVKGGTGDDSGQIRADGKLTSATIGGLEGNNGARSGSIRTGQGVIANGTGAIIIKGAMTGNGGTTETGAVIAEGKIASVLVSGPVSGGTIRAGDDIASITVNGDVNAGTVFSARGKAIQTGTTDLAIGKVAISGSISNSKILAGYETSLTASNPDAQIGTVAVKGAWTASDLVAGVVDAGAAGFGIEDVKIAGADNAKIISQIASITIGGAVTGSVAPGDHFGFTAQKIVAMKVGPTPVPFTAAAGQSFDLAALGGNATNDVTAREVAI